MATVAIVPAAGRGKRFGGAKLLTPVGPVGPVGPNTMLECTLHSLLDAAIDRVILVVAPTADFSVVKALSDPRVRLVRNPDPDRGMFSSIQCGLEAAEGDPVLVLPADMPFVRSATIADVAAACARTRQIVVPARGGSRGHPVAFPASIRAAVLGASPDSTLKAALAATDLPQLELPVDDAGVLRDVDVPSDL